MLHILTALPKALSCLLPANPLDCCSASASCYEQTRCRLCLEFLKVRHIGPIEPIELMEPIELLMQSSPAQIAGAAFLLGAGLTAGAQNLPMLVCGRISLGVGVGFANQARAHCAEGLAARRWHAVIQEAHAVWAWCCQQVLQAALCRVSINADMKTC